jgi:hypothetical protein
VRLALITKPPSLQRAREKLVPRNVVRVRFNGSRTFVFPELPLEVIGQA